MPISSTARNRANVLKVANWLRQEHANRAPFVPFAEKRGIATLAAAYQVQREYVRLQGAERRVGKAGYKIGLTSTAMQAMCGIDSPVAGLIFDDRVHRSGVQMRRSDYGRFGIEFEIAARIGRNLEPLDRLFTLADIEAVVDAVAPAMEIVDDRHCDYSTLDVLSLIADNAWNAGVVLGEFCTTWPDLADLEGRVIVNDGSMIDKGRSREVLGHPLLSVVWLANHLRASGAMLEAGDVVMTGSLVTTKFPTESQCFRFLVSGLGSVDLILVE